MFLNKYRISLLRKYIKLRNELAILKDINNNISKKLARLIIHDSSYDKYFEKSYRYDMYNLEFVYKNCFWTCQIFLEKFNKETINIDFLPGLDLDNNIKFAIEIKEGNDFEGEIALQQDTEVNKIFREYIHNELKIEKLKLKRYKLKVFICNLYAYFFFDCYKIIIVDNKQFVIKMTKYEYAHTNYDIMITELNSNLINCDKNND